MRENRTSGSMRGCRKRATSRRACALLYGGSPLVGGAGSIDTCQLLLLARSVLPAWGEPARPGLPPEGETGKGALNSLLPLAILFSWYMCPSH